MNAKARPVILDDLALNIFTDGSSFSEPRTGGIGIRIITFDDDGHEVPHDYLLPGYQHATNQEMELKACIEALRIISGRRSPVDVKDYTKVVIHTDSQYVVDHWYNAFTSWPRDRWHTRDGKPVVNATLWQGLVKAIRRVYKKVEFSWHKGHKAGNPHNKAADKLARASAKVPLHPPITPRDVRRKTTDKSTVAGSILPDGQCLTIRVIAERRLPVQGTNMYKCEVVSKGSPYRGNVDDLVCDDDLVKRGHTYFVRLNDDLKNPRIVKVFREILPKTS
jgi:ribonuclease HI